MSEEETMSLKEIIALISNRDGLFFVCAYLFCLFYPFFHVLLLNVPLSRTIDAEGINGLLTISAIIFGFSGIAIEKRPIKRYLIIALICVWQAFLLLIVGVNYFMDIADYGLPTIATATLATTSLLTNVFSWMTIRYLRARWSEE